MLQKLTATTYVPAVPGVAASDAYEICTVDSPSGTGGSGSGSYGYVCQEITMPIGSSLQFGAGSNVTVVSYGESSVTYRICTWQWIPNG